MNFLASLPGKIKQLRDRWDTRLSATRAVKIDNLDTTISSRAPSSTALSTSVWTNTRAGYLDTSISSRAPASTALSTSVWTNARAAKLDQIAGVPSSIVGKTVSQTATAFSVLPPGAATQLMLSAASSLTTALSVTGAGYINYLGIRFPTTSSNLTVRVQLTIDGTVVLDESLSKNSSNYAYCYPVGVCRIGGNYGMLTFEAVRFSSSFVVKYQCGIGTTRLAYTYTLD